MLTKLQLLTELVLVLDGIRDPGNLGTIIRIADWFGIKQIACSMDCVDMFNTKTLQSSMGSFQRIEIGYFDLENLLEQYPKVNTYAAVIDGKNVFNMTGEKEGFLIIGSESHGIRPALATKVQHRISIPKMGGAESLNAGVATGILCAFFKK